ncbi:YqeG family HAD IIIA-type phosphatase [Fastidiosibacter lacustris]|uniref:YqeG family HAD IIIA-type phosphatase n=1 Tax=Fastidiosibacter lacustris TaxID=2056695 RepID=UPI000E34973E|nr:HAD family hydrolase [Fastidiosibacter lacustris]
MGRFSFTIKNSISQRKKIKAICQNKHQIDQVTQLNPNKLKVLGIKYIALDFDGVLAPHGQPLPDEHIFDWLKVLSQKYSQKNVFILSNKPTLERAEYFANNFPNIRFINDVAKKPYPDGLIKIQQLVNCKPRELALVDDRLLTGCLACILAGSFPILVTKPYTNYLRRPFQESFFSFLRFIEKLIFLK